MNIAVLFYFLFRGGEGRGGGCYIGREMISCLKRVIAGTSDSGEARGFLDGRVVIYGGWDKGHAHDV